MTLRRMSLMQDIENELWVLLEDMRRDLGISPSDAHVYIEQCWAKTKRDWEREYPEDSTDTPPSSR